MWLWTSLGPSLLTAMFRPLLLLLSLGGAVGCGCPGTNQVYVLHKAPMTGWYTFVPGEEGFQLVVSLEDEVDIKYKLVYLRTRQVWMIKEIRSPMINDLFTWNSTSAQGDGVNNVRIFCPGQCKCRKVKVKGHKCFRGYYGRTDVVEQLKRDEIARLEQEALTKAMSLTKGLALMTPPPGPRQLPSTVTKGEGALESLFRQMSGKNKNLPKVKVQSPFSSSSSSSTRKTLSRVKRFSMSSQRSRNQQASIDFLRALADDQFHLEDDGAGFQDGRADAWHDDLEIDQVDNSLDKQDDMRDRQVMLTSQLVDITNGRQDGLENDQQDDMLSSRLIDMSNGRQADLQNGQQIDMLSSQLIDMTNGRRGGLQDSQQVDMLSSQLIDMTNGRQGGLQNGQQIDISNGRKGGLQNGQQDMLSSQLLDMANGRRSGLQDSQQVDMLSSQLLDMTNGRKGGLQNGQQDDMLSSQLLDMTNGRKGGLQNGQQIDMLSSQLLDMANGRRSGLQDGQQDDMLSSQLLDMANGRRSGLQDGQQDDMLSSQLLDMANGRRSGLQDGQQDDVLSSQLLDMANGRSGGLQDGQQDDVLSSQLLGMANGRRSGLQDGQQDDMLSSQLLDMANGRRSGLQDGQQVELSRNRQNGRQADMLNGGHFDLVNDRQSDHSNDCQVDLANGQQSEMLNNWQGSRQEGQRDIQQSKRKETPSNEQQDDLLAHLLSAQSQVRQTDSLVLSNMLPKKPARKKSILQETLAMLNKLSKCVSSPLESLSSTEKTPTEPCAAGTHPIPAKSKPKPLRDRTQAKRARRNFNLTLLQDYKDSHIESPNNEVDEEEIVQCQPDVYAYMSGAEYMITRSETGHFWWIGIGDDLFAVSDEGGPCLDQLPAHTKWMTAIDNKKVKRNANVTVQCVDWDPSYFI